MTKTIPITVLGFSEENQPACNESEPFALMVLGDSMAPEFNEGEIIIIEPGQLTIPDSYILAFHNEEYIFRQLIKTATGWCLHALNDSYADVELTDMSAIRGIITQKSRPGKRSATKIYIA